MANRRKKSTRWKWTHSIMWWAFVISGIVHLGLVYFLPTVDILPAEPGYIEIDETWLATLPDDGAVGELSGEPIDAGTEPASPPDISTAWNLPPRTDAIEPASATERNTENVWETAFIGVNPTLSETFETPERERATVIPPVDIPPLTPPERTAQTYAKHMPTPDVIEKSAPEIRPETDVELQAEQRFQDGLFSNASQSIPKAPDLERLPATLPETLEAHQEALPMVASISRESLVQPERLPAAASVIPSPIQVKPLPPVSVPEIPERPPLEDEDMMAATEAVMNFPEVPAAALRKDPADELPEPEAQLHEALAAQPAFLPEPQQQDRTGDPPSRLQQDAGTAVPVSFNVQSPTLARVADKTSMASLSGSSRKRELTLNDGEMQAVKPEPLHRTSQVSEEPKPPVDAPRPIKPKALTTPERTERIPAGRLTALSRTQRSLILGAKDHVPTLPLDGPRFGILAQKDTSTPEEEVSPDTELHPNETVQHAEEEPEQQAAEFVIEGPAATREVLLKPRQFPDVELDMDVTIRLKFWVLPDGTVGEVLPLQRGDVRLERAAIAYMKNWRFTPVSPDQPQVWGIIPITYTLR